MAFIAALPLTSSSLHLRRPRTLLSSHRRGHHVARNTRPMAPHMSGVNGGIDYEIDLSSLPASLSARVQSVQQGADSPTDLINSARAIASSASSYPSVLPVLVDMLGFNNPVAASICVRALSEAGSAAVPPLLTGVAAFNYAVNAYALRALGLIGDPSTADVCIACAEKGPIPGVRRAACKALGSLRFTNSTQAVHAFEVLVKLIQAESDWGVRYAAIAALETFTALDKVVKTGNDVIDKGVQALHAAAGLSNDSESDAAPTDDTVRARAEVAIEVFGDRISG